MQLTSGVTVLRHAMARTRRTPTSNYAPIKAIDNQSGSRILLQLWLKLWLNNQPLLKPRSGIVIRLINLRDLDHAGLPSTLPLNEDTFNFAMLIARFGKETKGEMKGTGRSVVTQKTSQRISSLRLARREQAGLDTHRRMVCTAYVGIGRGIIFRNLRAAR